jgi:hypothetical protein
MQFFKVTTTHPVPRFAVTDLLVRVSEYAGTDLFYCDAPGFGCGKNGTTPHRAIHSLFGDSACTVVKIVDVPYDEGYEAWFAHLRRPR